MSLTWAQIGDYWPDAVVYWDRDIAPTLDWEPIFRARGLVPCADDPSCPHQRGHFAAPGECRCLIWTGEEWLARAEAWRRVWLRHRIGDQDISLSQLANVRDPHDWHIRTERTDPHCHECGPAYGIPWPP